MSPSADDDGLVQPSDEESRDLLDRYTAAFTTMDVEALKGTLREDVLLQMPPFGEWLLGRDAIGEFLATGFARGGSFRCTAMRANGQAALGVYRRRNDDAHRFHQVQVLTMTETGIARIDAFLVNALYAPFGLPAVLEDEREWVGGVTEPSRPDLKGIRALVTGGTSGLGFAMSQALAEAGARVALTGRTEPRVQDAVTRIARGDQVTGLVMDVRDEYSVTAGVDRALTNSVASTCWSTTPGSACAR